jgi:hypothetical protein
MLLGAQKVKKTNMPVTGYSAQQRVIFQKRGSSTKTVLEVLGSYVGRFTTTETIII